MFCNLLLLLAVLLVVAANAHDHHAHDHAHEDRTQYIMSLKGRVAARREVAKTHPLPALRIEEAADLEVGAERFSEIIADNDGPYTPYTGTIKLGKKELTMQEFRRSGSRCGTHESSPNVSAEVEAKIGHYQARREGNHLRSAAAGPFVDIPVYFNVFITEDGSMGNIPNRFIDRQIDVLNNAFGPVGFHFTLMNKRRIYSDEYFYLSPGSTAEIDSRTQLNVPGLNNLNIYTGQGGGYLGWAYFPEDGVVEEAYNGVNLDFGTLPGGSSAPYNKGDTLVHEVGHWLGLHHTFNGGCGRHNGYGDGVRDTPGEEEPAFECVARDSCPELRGKDPIHNFMDYTDDRCLTGFTPGQGDRMHAMWDTYRAGQE